MSEIFSETFKGKLSFQNMFSNRVFFTKVEDHSYVSNLIFSTIIFTGNDYEHFFLRNIVGCCQYRNPSQTAFVEIISSPNYLRNGLCWSHVFIETEL